MGLKELGIEGKQFGMKKLFYARNINLGVLDPRMITMDEERSESQEQEKQKALTLQETRSLRKDYWMSLFVPIADFLIRRHAEAISHRDAAGAPHGPLPANFSES